MRVPVARLQHRHVHRVQTRVPRHPRVRRLHPVERLGRAEPALRSRLSHAVELQDRSGGLELDSSGMNQHIGLIEDGRVHLGCDEALPNQGIELEQIGFAARQQMQGRGYHQFVAR